MNNPTPEWLAYEHALLEYLQLSHSESDVRHNVFLTGRMSGAARQIDVLVAETLAGSVVRTAFEAKHYNRRLNVKNVEEAIGLFRDVGVDRGVIVTLVGYSEAAMRRANADDVDIELDILNLADLGPFQSDGGALPYAGSHGVVIPAPLGWIIDGSRSPIAPARLYRRGLSFEEAYAEPEFMYVGFWTKDEEASSLEELAANQAGNIRDAFPAAETTIEAIDLGKKWKGAIQTALNAYPWPEITAYVEFDDFILFVVLHTHPLVEKRNRRKLEYVVRKALPFTLIRKSAESNP